MSGKEWQDFFQDAGISSSEAQTYKAAFAQHNIRSDMLEDLDKEDLRDMGDNCYWRYKENPQIFQKGNVWQAENHKERNEPQ